MSENSEWRTPISFTIAQSWALITESCFPLRWFAATMVANGLTAVVITFTPLSLGAIFDILRADHPSGHEIAAGLARFITTVALAALLGLVTDRCSVGFSAAALKWLAARQFAALQSVDLAHLGERSQGLLAASVDTVPEAVAAFFSATVVGGLQATTMLLIAVVILASHSVVLTAAAFGFLPLWLVTTGLSMGGVAAARSIALQARDRWRTFVNDRLTFNAIIRSRTFEAEALEMSRFGERLDAVASTSVAWTWRMSLLSREVSFVGTGIAPAIVLAVGSALFLHRAIGLGDLIAFVYLQPLLLGPIGQLSSTGMQLANAAPLFERLLAPRTLRGAEGPLLDDRKIVELVGARIRAGDGFTLQCAEFSVGPGEFIVVRGVSGAGKSSFCLALAGLLALETGHRSKRPDARLVYLGQSPEFITGSLMANLAYSKDVERGALSAVLELVELGSTHVFMTDRLDESFEGIRQVLSHGELQRLALARALLYEPHALIVDEALSGVDLSQEARIYGRIAERYPALAIVAVTHRSPALMPYTRSVSLADGALSHLPDPGENPDASDK